uniref:Bm11748 n=1 Tax=Brugia malayi TaxID=6279 RepID=A0A1I9GDS0_BRUMA|nr:Bm11748 [Brugia malayi]
MVWREHGIQMCDSFQALPSVTHKALTGTRPSEEVIFNSPGDNVPYSWRPILPGNSSLLKAFRSPVPTESASVYQHKSLWRALVCLSGSEQEGELESAGQGMGRRKWSGQVTSFLGFGFEEENSTGAGRAQPHVPGPVLYAEEVSGTEASGCVAFAVAVMCVCMCVCVRVRVHARIPQSACVAQRTTFLESVLSIHHVGYGD